MLVGSNCLKEWIEIKDINDLGPVAGQAAFIAVGIAENFRR